MTRRKKLLCLMVNTHEIYTTFTRIEMWQKKNCEAKTKCKNIQRKRKQQKIPQTFGFESSLFFTEYKTNQRRRRASKKEESRFCCEKYFVVPLVKKGFLVIFYSKTFDTIQNLRLYQATHRW